MILGFKESIDEDLFVVSFINGTSLPPQRKFKVGAYLRHYLVTECRFYLDDLSEKKPHFWNEQISTTHFWEEMYTKILVSAFQPMKTTLGPEFRRLSYCTNIDTRIDKSNQYCHFTFAWSCDIGNEVFQLPAFYLDERLKSLSHESCCKNWYRKILLNTRF